MIDLTRKHARPPAVGLIGLAVMVCTGLWVRAAESADPATTAAQLQQDWLRQAQLRYGPAAASLDITPADDAAGGCDGHIDGKWGFHTLQEPDPWWQVDLGRVVALDKVLVYNRCDGGFERRAAHLRVLLSLDGTELQSGLRARRHAFSRAHGWKTAAS